MIIDEIINLTIRSTENCQLEMTASDFEIIQK